MGDKSGIEWTDVHEVKVGDLMRMSVEMIEQIRETGIASVRVRVSRITEDPKSGEKLLYVSRAE